MAKCVFCGDKPVSKTKEHVIPQWLISNTGERDRNAFFGIEYLSTNKDVRYYSFSNFVFPACSDCNNKFSLLEKQAKRIIESILNEKPLSDTDFSTLFDWFDKIRVGLWLSGIYLDKDKMERHFHIEQRMGAFDRCLYLFKTSEPSLRLTWVGTATPTFRIIPSCFGLIINHYYFLNISSPFLFSHRLGFPHPEDKYFRNSDAEIEVNLTNGNNRKMYPVLNKKLALKGSKFYQPMFKIPKELHLYGEYFLPLYDNKYVRDNSLNWVEGIGKILIEKNSAVHEYPHDSSMDWIPNSEYLKNHIIKKFTKEVIEHQNMIIDMQPSTILLSKSDRKYFKKLFNKLKQFNKLVLKDIDKKDFDMFRSS